MFVCLEIVVVSAAAVVIVDVDKWLSFLEDRGAWEEKSWCCVVIVEAVEAGVIVLLL